MNKRTEEAARRFFYLIVPEGAMWELTDHKAKPLVLGAFHLYAQSWDRFDVRRWEWPFTTLREGQAFAGDEPWTVLLRRAAELATPL